MHNKLFTGAVSPRYQQYVIDLNEHVPLKMDHTLTETMEEKIYILEDNTCQHKLSEIENRENKEIKYRENREIGNKIDCIKCCSWEYIYDNPCCCCSLPIIIFILLCFKILILTILIYWTHGFWLVKLPDYSNYSIKMWLRTKNYKTFCIIRAFVISDPLNYMSAVKGLEIQNSIGMEKTTGLISFFAFFSSCQIAKCKFQILLSFKKIPVKSQRSFIRLSSFSDFFLTSWIYRRLCFKAKTGKLSVFKKIVKLLRHNFFLLVAKKLTLSKT